MDIEKRNEPEYAIVNGDFLTLIALCATKEQHYLDFYLEPQIQINKTDNNSSWRNVIEILIENLKFYQTQPFYNLSQLDASLECLVHVTASLGWSCGKTNSLATLVNCLCELMVIFHCRKGESAAFSLMGLSITRHAVIILNHVLAELRHVHVKNWETIFLDIESEWMESFVELCISRDVLLRAAVLQLFAGLAINSRLAIEFLNEIKRGKEGIWEMAMHCLIDNEEASLVRENAALLLTNLLLNIEYKLKISKNVESKLPIMGLLETVDFFKNVDIILNCLYTNEIIEYVSGYFDDFRKFTVKESPHSSITTPSLVKSVCQFLSNLLVIEFDQIAVRLHEFGLVKLFFKSLCIPNMCVRSRKSLMFYCDVLEMNSAICALLGQLAANSGICLGTILHTKDCMALMVALINRKLYYTYLPQLVYLRNKLWMELFRLIFALTNCEEKFGSVDFILDTLNDPGYQLFLETYCESIRSTEFNDLQNSALSSLTSLLKNDIHSGSLKHLLDTVQIPRITNEDCLNENQENIEPNQSAVLSSIYFDSTRRKTQNTSVVDHICDHFAGGEICKNLLNLYDLSCLKVSKEMTRKRSTIIVALSCILHASNKAKEYAYKTGFLQIILKQLKDIYVQLSLESIECLRRIADKKRICPVLRNLNDLIGLINNFMVGCDEIKTAAANLGLPNLLHKLWIWFGAQKSHLDAVLRLLNTFTVCCGQACVALTLTSPIAGCEPRKMNSESSLLNALVVLINREMDQISKTHDLNVMELCFRILCNCCKATECRVALNKANLFTTNVNRLHSIIVKKQKPWDQVEIIWLEFLKDFTTYNEGQSSAKHAHIFELMISLTNSQKLNSRIAALTVLRNFAFYQPNRARLLSSGDFLNVLQTKLDTGNNDEKLIVVLIMWALAANNQRAKVILKSAQLHVKLLHVLRQFQISNETISDDDIRRVHYVLKMILDDVDCNR